MTKLIQQLSFSSSNYFEAAAIEPNPNVKPKIFSESVSLNEASSKRSAISASDAECFSLCLGAGPLCVREDVPQYYLCHFVGGPDVPAQNSAPPGGVNSGASSPATPSTPTHDDNCDLLSSLLCSASISDSSESLPAAATNAASRQDLLNDQAREQVISKILERKARRPVKVDFKIYLTENTATRWEAVVLGPTLYLRIPGVLSAGSKDSFVTLLDFAEERLNCTNCIVCIRKNRSDRAALVRTFMFLGFQLLPPASPLLPADLANPEYMFLNYNMN